ncbi:MAG: FAD-dependent oxidoreductase [Sulfurovum sp.]|nr:FAD-dependent oxidoreductase [Sulfurovum sp.]
MEYDVLIVGAGIAGATLAYTLHQQNHKVLLVDKSGIASGGSGSAGAFVSPKIGKGSPLQTLTNKAFDFAKDFYTANCPQYFHQTGIVRIPKDKADADKFSSYASVNTNPYTLYSPQTLAKLGIDTAFESFYFPEAGDCDAVEVCQWLLRDITVIKHEVKSLHKVHGLWKIDKYWSRHIVLATGYEHDLAEIDYMGIRGKWGTRGDFSSAFPLSVSMHQSLSIGANRQGIIKIGATHENGIQTAIPCQKSEIMQLKSQAQTLIDTSDLVLKQIFCGMRAGCKDYFPLIGKVIDVPSMLAEFPILRKGGKPSLRYKENLYIFGGLGGRGFVFAPLMAQYLSECIMQDKAVPTEVSADRLFFKWCRKL